MQREWELFQSKKTGFPRKSVTIKRRGTAKCAYFLTTEILATPTWRILSTASLCRSCTTSQVDRTSCGADVDHRQLPLATSAQSL